MKYNIDPSFGIYRKFNPPVSIPMGKLAQKMMAHGENLLKKDLDLNVTYLPQDDFEIIKISRKNSHGKKRALLFFAGGGFFFPPAPCHYKEAAKFVKEAHLDVYLIRYSLLPKGRFSLPCKQAYQAFTFLREHADSLEIDLHHLGVFGDSAGGYLASWLFRAAKVKDGFDFKMQMLIYPVLDWRMKTQSMQEYVDTPMWNGKNNRIMWHEFLKDDKNAPNLLMESVPDYKGKSYIETAEFDCLHDEDIDYAKRLIEFGNKVELVDAFRTMHGFEIVNNAITKASIENRIQFLKNNL